MATSYPISQAERNIRHRFNLILSKPHFKSSFCQMQLKSLLIADSKPICLFTFINSKTTFNVMKIYGFVYSWG